MLSDGSESMCRGTEAALDCCGNGELVGDAMLLVMRRSSTLLRAGTDDTCSNDLSVGPPSAATMSASDTPRLSNSKRSFLFSSSTFLAAHWISAESSMPTCSQFRNLASSSWRYSLRRARERPAQSVSACFRSRLVGPLCRPVNGGHRPQVWAGLKGQSNSAVAVPLRANALQSRNSGLTYVGCHEFEQGFVPYASRYQQITPVQTARLTRTEAFRWSLISKLDSKRACKKE